MPPTRTICHVTFGKGYELAAMLDAQEHRPPNRRRVCPGTTPAQIVSALAQLTPEERARIAEAGTELEADLRGVMLRYLDLTTGESKP